MRYSPFLALVALMSFACSPDRRVDDDDTTTPPAPDAGGGTTTTPDAGGGTTTTPDAGTLPTNHPPSASLVTPTGPQRGDVRVSYLLFDADRDLVNVAVEWSEDGTHWSRASTVSATQNLAAGPDGVEQLFVWSSAQDVGGRSASVRLRLVPSDSAGPGAPGFTAGFTVDNATVTPNQPPSGAIGSLAATVAGDVALSLNLSDADGDSLTTTVEFHVGNDPWQRATLSSGNPSVLGASAGGSLDTLVWQSATDIPQAASVVQLRATLDDGHGHTPLPVVLSNIFAVDNRPPAAPNGMRIVRVNAGAPDWFEVRNNGTQSVSIAGWSLRITNVDGSTATLTVPSTGNTTFPPGFAAIVTEESGTSGSGTVYLSSAQTTQNISWAPGFAGSLELLDAAGNSVDFIRWGGCPTTPSAGAWREPKLLYLPQDGASLVRMQPTVDTDSAADFCAARSPRPGPSTGCLPSAPAGTVLRFSEISLGAGLPPLSSGSPTRWVELMNDGPALNLSEFVLLGLDGRAAGQLVLPSVTVRTGERLLIREGSGSESTSGGVHTIFTNGGTLAGIAGTSGVFELVDPAGAPLDFVRWANDQSPPPAPLTFAASPLVPAPSTTASIGRKSETSTTVAPDAWCVMASPTPGTPSAGCRAPPVSTGLRINEVGTGKFNLLVNTVPGYVEFKNASTAQRSLAGYTIRWTGSGSLSGPGSIVFADVPATNLAPGARVTVYECGLAGTVGQGCDVQTFPWGAGQPSGAQYGSVELLDPDGRTVDFMRWGGSTDVPTGGSGWSDSPAALGPIPTANGPWGLARTENAPDRDLAGDWCVQIESPDAANVSTCN